jgi:hypothetical protein
MSHAPQGGGQASDQANARRPGRCRQPEQTGPFEGTSRGPFSLGVTFWPPPPASAPHAQNRWTQDSQFSLDSHPLRLTMVVELRQELLIANRVRYADCSLSD